MKSGPPQNDSPAYIRLSHLPVGGQAIIREIQGGQILMRRLLSLGLRIGSQVEVLHHRGRGVVAASAGNRIALGGGIAEKLLVEPFPDPTPKVATEGQCVP
jgi:ferrous iron transport protein A